MTSFERFLINLDTWPAGAFLRIGLGLCILPVFRLLSGGDDRIVVALTMFLALLLALRLVPAVCRRVLPFSREAKDLWFKRRNLGKRYELLPVAKAVLDGPGHAALRTDLWWNGARGNRAACDLYDRWRSRAAALA
ncbi:hypothetical protein [Bradyrhizobium sp. BR 1433]|uniref:hypothetical protein n=1 Tax=Bradyrhizobium sp. BR 1433 TaxID=3447967 RepID=UPI003EE7D265